MNVVVLMYSAVVAILLLLSSYDMYKWRNRWIAIVLLWGVISFVLLNLRAVVGEQISARFPWQVVCGAGVLIIVLPFLWRIWRSQRPLLKVHAVLRQIIIVLCVLAVLVAFLFGAYYL
jgi:hypothetical protein